jgi:hypothetical protein
MRRLVLVLVLCCAASHAIEEGRDEEDGTAYPFCGATIHNGSPVSTLNANAHGAMQLPKGTRGVAMCNNTDFQVRNSPMNTTARALRNRTGLRNPPNWATHRDWYLLLNPAQGFCASCALHSLSCPSLILVNAAHALRFSRRFRRLTIAWP